MEYKTLDQLYEEGDNVKVAFFEQLLPEDVTEEQKKFFRKIDGCQGRCRVDSNVSYADFRFG